MCRAPLLHFFLFRDTSSHIQQKVATVLYEQWQDNFKGCNIKNIDDLVNTLKQIYLCFVVLFDNSEFIGTVCVKIDTPVETFNTNYWICNLFVVKEHRSKRIGQDILQFTERYMFKEKNVHVLHLWCNIDLVNFYKKNDWILSEADSKNIDTKIMIKMISSYMHNRNPIVFHGQYFF